MNHHECPTTKVCNECGEEKVVEEFTEYFDKRKGRKFIKSKCKVCANAAQKKKYHTNEVSRKAKLKYQKIQRATPEAKAKTAVWHKKYNQENAERLAKRSAEYRARPEVRAAEKLRADAYYSERKVTIQAKRKARLDADSELKEAELQRGRDFYKKNVSYYTEKTERRRARVRKATPPWYEAEPVIELREQVRKLTDLTGITFEVDHIIPLQGENVSGLHCINNMQILTKADNRTKSNKF